VDSTPNAGSLKGCPYIDATRSPRAGTTFPGISKCGDTFRKLSVERVDDISRRPAQSRGSSRRSAGDTMMRAEV